MMCTENMRKYQHYFQSIIHSLLTKDINLHLNITMQGYISWHERMSIFDKIMQWGAVRHVCSKNAEIDINRLS